MNEPTQIQDEVARQLQGVLDRNGFSFQYAVLRRFEELRKLNQTSWVLEGAEIPVGADNNITHIDFVLRHKSKDFFLVAECKRVDPARGYWCFANASYTWRQPWLGITQFDQILAALPRAKSLTKLGYSEQTVKDIALEVKSKERGDGVGSQEKSAINSAVSQVLRGSTGFMHHLFNDYRMSNRYRMQQADISENDQYIFIPVIFTTARLFVTDVDLATATLATGHLPDNLKVEEKEWIWFNHNRSSSLSPKYEFDHSLNTQYSPHFREFTRSVAIVSPSGIDEFLQTDFPGWLY